MTKRIDDQMLANTCRKPPTSVGSCVEVGASDGATIGSSVGEVGQIDCGGLPRALWCLWRSMEEH